MPSVAYTVRKHATNIFEIRKNLYLPSTQVEPGMIGQRHQHTIYCDNRTVHGMMAKTNHAHTNCTQQTHMKHQVSNNNTHEIFQ
jgi:precorrin isomerase